MNNIKKIGLLLLISGLITGFAQAAEKPDATLRLSGGSLAAGIGFSWGKGTLTYKGKDYPVSVNGLSLGKVGISGASAYGEVYNLKKLQDFNGHYHAGGGGDSCQWAKWHGHDESGRCDGPAFRHAKRR